MEEEPTSIRERLQKAEGREPDEMLRLMIDLACEEDLLRPEDLLLFDRALSHLLKPWELKVDTAHGEMGEPPDAVSVRTDAFAQRLIGAIDNRQLPHAQSTEAKVFFGMKKGDLSWAIGSKPGGDRQKAAFERAEQSYKAAQDVATADLHPAHPMRLEIALHLSSFFAEALKAQERACELAKHAFDDAIANLDGIDEESDRKSMTLLQALTNKLSQWTDET